MQIHNINNTNFKGGYKFIAMPSEVRKELNEAVKKGKTIYDSFQGNPDNVFMVAKDQFHDAILLFIKKHNLKFEYYPGIKSSMDFKLGHPEKLEQILETQTPEEIVFDENLTAKLAEHKQKMELRQKQNEYLPNILKTLKLDMDKTTRREKYGVTVFQNKNHTKDIYISAPNESKIHYVKVLPKVSSSDCSPVEMYAITSQGEITYNYTHNVDKWSDFYHNFSMALIK